MESLLRRRLVRHARFSATVRAFFDGRGYAEVDTPTLSPFLIPEPAIEVFRTEYLAAQGASRPLWLIPSPELWMKRLMARGSGNIYQISRSFRNGDTGSPHHNPEFRLLEWYTIGADYRDAIAVTEDLFAHLLSHARPRAAADRLAPPFLRMTMEEAFLRYAGIELGQCLDARTMKEAGERQGIAIPAAPTWEEAFHVAFLTLVEPSLPRGRPLVLTDYPALVPTTARRSPGTPWAQRWELYAEGVELANCYTEETDPEALRSLLAQEEARKRECRVPHAVDRGFPEIFGPDFPTCTGVALGVDRLEMIFQGESTLEGVILFPFSAIVRGQSSPSA